MPLTQSEALIHPYEIMLVLSAEAAEEEQQEILERVQQIIRNGGGTIDHLNQWGRRKLAYQMAKQPDGHYTVITCEAPAATLEEIERVLAINRDLALRSMFVRLERAEAERAREVGAPTPVDEPVEAPRPGRGRGGGRRRGRP